MTSGENALYEVELGIRVSGSEALLWYLFPTIVQIGQHVVLLHILISHLRAHENYFPFTLI